VLGHHRRGEIDPEWFGDALFEFSNGAWERPA